MNTKPIHLATAGPLNAKQKRTLSQLQRLQTIFEHATAIDLERNPRGNNDDDLADACRQIADNAREAFHAATWRFPFDVPTTDLSTVNPAAWIRERLGADGVLAKN